MASPKILRRARDKLVRLASRSLTRRRHLHGRRFLVPSVLPGLTGPLQSEDWLFPLLAQLLAARPGVVLDVGANIGQTLVKVKAADWARPYIGIEPNPACVHFLKTFIALNRIPEALVIPAGLSDHAHLGRFLSREANAFDTSASVVDGFAGKGFTAPRWPMCPCCKAMTWWLWPGQRRSRCSRSMSRAESWRFCPG